jgi:hypothetical protein
LAQAYANTPMAYVPNVGQTDPSVHFAARGAGLGVYLTDSGATFDVPVSGQEGTRDAFALRLVGATPSPTILTQDELPSTSNFFSGSDPSGWHANVPNFGAVVYQGIYAGTDLTFRSAGTRQMEYTFTLAPGADPSAIKLAWDGVNSLSVDQSGNLVLQTPGGPVVQQAAAAYQGTGAVRTAVSVSQVVNDDGTVSFQLGPYDNTKPLVIDPSINYSS